MKRKINTSNKENNTKIIKEGKKISKNEIDNNFKDTKKKILLMYTVPLAFIVVCGIAYILTQKFWILFPFGIFFFIALFGWDGSGRTCSNCKKWNSCIIIKSDKKENIKVKKTKNFIGKEKEKKIKEKRIIAQHQCKNCGQIIEIDKEQLNLFK